MEPSDSTRRSPPLDMRRCTQRNRQCLHQHAVMSLISKPPRQKCLRKSHARATRLTKKRFCANCACTLTSQRQRRPRRDQLAAHTYELAVWHLPHLFAPHISRDIGFLAGQARPVAPPPCPLLWATAARAACAALPRSCGARGAGAYGTAGPSASAQRGRRTVLHAARMPL
jgi:hypothetical protein